MTLAERMVATLEALPRKKQEEALDFVEFLLARNSTCPRRSLAGLWADLDIDVTEEDIAEARREMWGGFPRVDIA